jgi:membrane-associated protease RseP (regulator of RpoE activity)
MSGYVTLRFLRILGAPVHMHWSAFVLVLVLLATSIKEPLSALFVICCYLSIILLHESGHAYVAWRLGCRPINIYLGFFHGLCEHEAPFSQKHECFIVWGGVLAQFVIAVPLIIVGATTSLAESFFFGPIIGYLGYVSGFVALVNLAPMRGLDGGTAWQLFPILLNEHRYRATSKRARPKSIRRIK